MGHLLGVGIGVVLVGGVIWFLSVFWTRKARKVRAENPTAWVQPVTRGRTSYLLYLDSTVIKLISMSGHDYQVHARSDLTDAEVGWMSFPLATRASLVLQFRDGTSMELLGARRAGFSSSSKLAESAVDYLNGTDSSSG